MKTAEDIHKELGMLGISRSDFMLKDNELYFFRSKFYSGNDRNKSNSDLATLQGYTFDDIVKLMVETFK